MRQALKERTCPWDFHEIEIILSKYKKDRHNFLILNKLASKIWESNVQKL